MGEVDGAADDYLIFGGGALGAIGDVEVGVHALGNYRGRGERSLDGYLEGDKARRVLFEHR